MSGDYQTAIATLKEALPGIDTMHYRPQWILEETKTLLLSLGTSPETNDYCNLSLQDYLQKNRNKGSFTLREELLSYLRLALREWRKIDITSISMFFTKYYNRHDYSLNTIDEALVVFEKMGFVSWQDSIKLITRIQDQSEKGYRGLLACYLMLHEPKFIEQVLSEFEIDDLRISWFDLNPEYVNVLPYELYIKEVIKLFNYHHYNHEIELRELKNVLHSDWLETIKKNLRIAKFYITVKLSDPGLLFLENNNIPYKIQPEEQQYKETTVQELFDRGIIDKRNIDSAIQKGFDPETIAQYSNGNGWAFAHPEFFQRFPITEIRSKLQLILYNFFTARSQSIDYFHSVFLLPGNIIRLIEDCNAEEDLRVLFDTYREYLELSMFDVVLGN
jgi:hypothetical protein